MWIFLGDVTKDARKSIDDGMKSRNQDTSSNLINIITTIIVNDHFTQILIFANV